ncbi:MAG: hypothetical protein HXX11_17080, partial [Desulfuromonadales bacterium]|nr:hypothetical protein [Desulfuromonadales bacterium]
MKIPFYSVCLLIVLVAMHMPVCCVAADTSVEDLLKKSESSASPFSTSTPVPQFAPTTPILPKTEQPKLLNPEKARLGSDETALVQPRDMKEQDPRDDREQGEGRETRKDKQQKKTEKSESSAIEKLISA